MCVFCTLRRACEQKLTANSKLPLIGWCESAEVSHLCFALADDDDDDDACDEECEVVLLLVSSSVVVQLPVFR